MKKWIPRIAALSFALALVLLLLVVASGPGYKAGFWNFRTGITLMRMAGMWSMPILILALLSTRRATLKLTFPAIAITGIILSGALYWKQRAESLPMIHDITTDTLNPPEFVAIAPLRKDALNPLPYPGPEVAAKQVAAYPDIRTLSFTEAPEKVFESALETARSMGWEIVAAEKSTLPLRIEATVTTAWFGFKDDVVMRLQSRDSGGTRLDIRSKSRVGMSDVGANARRISEFSARLADALPGKI